MSKFFIAAIVAAFLTVSSNAQAKPTKSGCASISQAKYNQATKLSGASKATFDRMLGTSCALSGYRNGLTAYGYKLSYDSKNWFVVVFQNGRQYKTGIVPYRMGLRAG